MIEDDLNYCIGYVETLGAKEKKLRPWADHLEAKLRKILADVVELEAKAEKESS